MDMRIFMRTLFEVSGYQAVLARMEKGLQRLAESTGSDRAGYHDAR
jgi:hypothetical protein